MESEKIFAVLDTNILVSGLLARSRLSAVVQVFDAVMNGRIIPVLNEEIMAEYTEVLKRPSLKLPLEQVDVILSFFRLNSLWTERVHSEENFPDPKDIVFFEIALSKENIYLVTGNSKHFPIKPFVVTPAEMLVILNNL